MENNIPAKPWHISEVKLRNDVIAGYGGRCACCGESQYEFLSLDHVNGGGTIHLKGNKMGGDKRVHYRDARNRNYPPDYRILCHNCNFALGHYGHCPHDKERKCITTPQ